MKRMLTGAAIGLIVGAFYDYSEEFYGRRTFDRAISGLDFDQIETILSGYLYRLRNLQKHGSSGNQAHDIWNTCLSLHSHAEGTAIGFLYYAPIHRKDAGSVI